jgi:N12 class adenine-specific DNA methylase
MGNKERYEQLMQQARERRFEQDVAKVDDEYLRRFSESAGSYLDSAKKQYDGLGYGNAYQSYLNRRDSYTDLDYRRRVIQEWNKRNPGNLDQQSASWLDSFGKDSKGILDSFYNAKDFFSLFESEDAYNGWRRKEDFINQYLADPEKAMSAMDYEDGWLREAQYRLDSQVLDAKDFPGYSKYRSTMADSRWDKAWSQYSMGYNDLTYEFINNQNNIRDEILKKSLAIYSDSPFRNSKTVYEMKHYDFMTEEEVSIYNYYYAKEGKKRAEEYLDTLAGILEERSNQNTVENVSKTAREHPFLASVASVGTSLGSGFEFAGDALSFGIDKVMGKDARMGTNELGLMTNAVRGTVSDMVDWEIGNWDAFDFVYSTVMSGADSLTSGMLGGAGGLVLGLSAAAQGTNDALQRGMSSDKAFWNGLFSGVFEGLFESVSLGNFNKLKEVAPDSVKTIFKNIGKSMLVNASEETLTEIANIGYDTLMNGEFANYTWEDLKNGAWKNALAQVLESGASGALMGAGFGVTGNTIGYAGGSMAAKQLYGADPGALVRESLEIDPENRFAQRMRSRVSEGKKLSGGQLMRLAMQNESAITAKDMRAIREAASARLSELGETGDINALAAMIAKQAAGDKLTRSEKAAIAGSVYGQRVADELNPDSIRENGNAEAELPFAMEEAPKAAPKAAATVLENRTVSKKEAVDNNLEATDEESTEVPPVSLEEAAKGYGAQAQAMIHTYEAGQDVKKYDAAYRAAYDMGRSGVSLSYTMKSQSTAYLSENQRKLAHAAGVDASGAAAKARARQIQPNGKTGRKKGTVKGEGVTIADLKKTFNDTQGRAYKILSTVAEVTGIDIVLYRSQADEGGKFQGAQGKYRRSEPGTLYIDLNAGLSDVKDANDLGKYAMLRTFSHEFTHFIENWNPGQYNELRKAVFQAMEENGEEPSDLIELKMEQNPGMDYEAASREVVAEAMTDILEDSSFIQTLAEKHKTVFQKLVEKLKEFVEELRSYFASIGSNPSREAKAIKQQVGENLKYFEGIVELFDRAAVQAVENYQSTAAEDVVVAENATTATDNATGPSDNATETVDNAPEDAKFASVDATLATENATLADESEATTEATTAEAEEVVDPLGFTIRNNAEHGSLEISFEGKPSDEVRHALRENKFRWHKVKKVWFGYTDRQTITDALHKAYAADEAQTESKSAEPAEPVVQAAEKDQYDEIGDALTTANLFRKGGFEFRVDHIPGAGYNGTIKRHSDAYISNARNTLLNSMFATREEAVSDLIAAARNAKLFRDASVETTKPKEEVTDNGRTENGTDQEAVPEPQRRGAEPARLLDAVEPEAVPGGSEGRQPVRTVPDEGAGAAGRDGRADPPAEDAGERGQRDRLAGDLQQLQPVTEDVTDKNVGNKSAEDKNVPGKSDPVKLREIVVDLTEQRSTESPRGGNFVIGDSLNLPGGTKARVRANIDAIRLVKRIAAEGRFATAQEQEVLSKYVGWGGLADAFGKPTTNFSTRKIEYQAVKGLESEFEELKTVLTEEEYKSARESTKNAHYTSIEVIKAMYDGLKHLGFTGGRMLEPSSGVGNFVGAMPADMTSTVKSWTMVELDNITGLFAKYLYPNADVRIQGFEEANIPDGYMDVAIGNVPFGNYAVVDKKYPKAVKSGIHNYFFAKSLDKVRPGGLVMFITSHYTMDSRDNAVRKYIAQWADLLGAIRLPNTAFAGNAGTSVVTDILILKKRADKTAYAGEDFQDVTWQNYSGGGAAVNSYFANHPEMVLGEVALARGMYSAYEMTVNPHKDKGSLGEQIRRAMENIQGRMDYSQQLSPEKANFRQAEQRKRRQKLQVKDGVVHTLDETGKLTKLEVDEDTAKRISGMVAIRDAHGALCDGLLQGVNKRESNALRKKLNAAYDSFVEKYGYLNSPRNKKAINSFADRYAILSLENVEGEGKKMVVSKSDIFSRDTIAPNRTAQSAETVEEGLTISMNTVGRVDAAMIARLTGQTEASVQRQMIDQRLVFKDKDGNLIPAVQYLSGNVRAKLRLMEGLVGIDPDYKHNVEALREVVPPKMTHADIHVNPGATWVPAQVYEDFVSHILDRYNHENWRTGKKDFSVTYVAETNEYKVEINDGYAKQSAQNTQVWGESGKSFAQIFENMLNGRRTNVYTEGPDGKRVIDRVKTEAVSEKAEKLGEEFRKWLWDDETRRSEMEELYNESFNALVTPKYSGESLTVNGLNATYTLRPHQKDAVARIINSGGNTLLAHRVGAGKTMEMAAAAMKLKQLGVVKKPMFVVPNNVVAQWGKEFSDYFPAANILVVGDEDMSPAERMTTINKIKNNDYDAVILAYTKFEKIQMTAAWRQKFYEEQIDSLLFAINAEKESSGGKGFTVKQLENKRKQLEARMKKLTEKAKDEDGAMFEDLGVDALFVDEAHNFKNLEYSTRMNNVSGLGKADGSQRAFDLYTKVRYLQQLNGGRGVVFATATPVMNSMTEMYIMQKYLQPDTLKQLGIEHFDSWAKMFGEVVNALEIAPSGSGYRVKQTFSKFKNVKALQMLFRSFTDVLTEVPGLKIPKMKGRKVQIVQCEQGEFQKNYMAELAERAENVRNVDPSEDNMLKITSDGRKISYSQRMIEPSLPYEETGKIYRCCENVAQVYRETASVKGTQMIFCDMATPKGKAAAKAEAETVSDEFAAVDTESAQLYDDMKARLVQLGIPEKEIAFIHDAKNDKQKAQLSEKMNNGTIRVLIGSTGKMGVGLNAQKKAVAIHHLDAPWRPGDIEQRDGRVFRQKNANEEAYKFVYVTKGSFDSRLWDILERKQKFINQVMNGEDVGNEIEDTGEVTLSAAEVKAVASDNPLIMEQVALEKEITKLQNLQQAHRAGVAKAQEKMVSDRRNIANLENLIGNVEADLKTRVDTYSDEKKFSMEIGGEVYRDKKDAGTALIAQATAKAVEGEYTAIGKFAGFTMQVVKTKEGINGILTGKGSYQFKTYPLNTSYGINHLCAVAESLDERLSVWKKNLGEVKADLTLQMQIAAEAFPQAEKLSQKRKRYNEVMDILNPPVEQHMGDDTQEQSREYLAPEQNQQRNSTLTDREVLAIAANEIRVDTLSEAEKSALSIFQERLGKLEDLQTKRAEEGRLYKEQQFGQKVDREAAAATLNRMHTLDAQIQRASSEVLDVEQKTVLREVLKKARKVVEKQQLTRDQQTLKRWRDRRHNADEIKKYRSRLSKDVQELTSWAIRPDNKNVVKHIPDALKQTVLPFLSSIDFTSKRGLSGKAATKADQEFIKRLRALETIMEESSGMDDMYANYRDLPPNFLERLHKFTRNTSELIESAGGGEFVVNRMTAEELKELSGIVRILKKYIMDMNKFHVNAMFQHVHEAGDNSIEFLGKLKPAQHTGVVSEFLKWQQMRPAYAFERFGEGGKAIYDGLRQGQATLAFDTKLIEEFAGKTYTTEEVRAWDKQLKTIKLPSGGTVTMKVSQIMSLYELSKRKQALGHILGEGIRVATFTDKRNKISDVGRAVTDDDLMAIFDVLTPRQKEVADKLQKFMQNQGGQWGNHVTLARFGEKQFGEENYFPINSDGRHLNVDADESPKNASLYALLNMGFTKQTQENAKNRIVVYSIFDVFANHMASMAQYHAFALPVVDALKWLNYKQTEIGEDGTKTLIGSVREEMDRAFGVPDETRPGKGKQGYAQNFVLGIIKAFNGTEAQGTPYDSFGMQTLHRYNRAQVAYNFRVVVQQPMAITRAAQLISYGSIMKGLKLRPAVIQKNVDVMRKYSGIAAWKSLGFYDVNISRGLTAIIKHDDTWQDKITDTGMWAAEKADTWTWAAMWAACKEEVISKGRLTPKNAGFYEAVTQLFEDVIYKTQVVDSVLTKNEFMRDKGFFARAVGSFMSEPTTTASMLIDAYDKFEMDMQRGLSRQQAWKRNSGNIVRTAYVYGIGALCLAAVQAVADSFRDDDDYQDFFQKWLEAFKGNLVDELMPINKLPIASDFYELAKELLSVMGVDTYGNPPQSVFMQWYDSLVKGVEILWDKVSGADTNYTLYGGVYKLLQAVSGMAGLPMAAATREIVTAWNNTVGAMAPSLKIKTYDPGDKNEIKYAYQDGWISEEEAAQQLISQELVDTEDEAYWTIRGWEAGPGYSKYDKLYAAALAGGDIGEALEELAEHGYSKKDAISQLKSQIGKWYYDPESENRITKDQATEMLRKYCGMKPEEITETVNKWSCKVVAGIGWNDIQEEYLKGNITAQRAVEMYVRYGGYDKERAQVIVSKWRAERETGIAYEDIDDAFLDGEITVGDVRNMYMTYGGLTQEEAEEKVTVLSFVKKNPALEDISAAAVRDYTEHCEPAGVKPKVFYDAWKYKNSIDSTGYGSVKEPMLEYINGLNLTVEQKDALYFAFGWAASKLRNTPWH